MLGLAAIIGVSSSLGYLLPAIIGLESMGIPSPGETALVAAAVLASQGKLQIELVLLIGIASAIIGDNVGYFLGRRIGRDVLVAPGPFHLRRVVLIRTGDRFFKRHGGKAVFLARWIALIRVAAAWLAGINHMPFKQFFFWNAFGGITWGITFGLVGYYGGHAGAHLLSRLGVVGAVILGLMLVGGLIWLKRHERRTARELEAEAQAEIRAKSRPEEAETRSSGGDSSQPTGGGAKSGSSSSAHELMQ
jgi:membrane protein DedA with SNARE-associated domain